ncbi:putative sporulation transcription regulator WhiA [bioreactor metagenome]|uniref:Putative sporulation transcription regulator WhiA n=1 Tax=bioreactor metagenome TaxID=1076179 RepID=A0A645E2K2_9ZZZZ
MSFSSSIKEELTGVKLKTRDEKKSALSAATHMIGNLSIVSGRKRVTYVSESPHASRYISLLATSLYSVQAEEIMRQQQTLNKNRGFVLRLSGEGVYALLKDTGTILSFGETAILPELVDDDKKRRAFFKGAFIASGFISNPQKNYHLDFVARDEAFAQEFCELLNIYDLNAKLSSRKGNFVIYLKESEKISSFLALIGASGALMELENIRIVKDIRNNANRAINCDAANITKSVNTALRQIDDIGVIRREIGLDALPQQLKEAAEARLSNQDATLSELGEMLGISKSGLNHRLKKLESLALELKIQKGEV